MFILLENEISNNDYWDIQFKFIGNDPSLCNKVIVFLKKLITFDETIIIVRKYLYQTFLTLYEDEICPDENDFLEMLLEWTPVLFKTLLE